MTLTRAEITAHLIKHNFPKCYAQSFVDDFFDIIAESLERGEEVKFSGFGNFEIKLKSKRLGRNPKTGEDFEISSRRVVTFRAGNKLQARLSSNAIAAESGEIINFNELGSAEAIREQVEIIHGSEDKISAQSDGVTDSFNDQALSDVDNDESWDSAIQAEQIHSFHEDNLISSGKIVTHKLPHAASDLHSLHSSVLEVQSRLAEDAMSKTDAAALPAQEVSFVAHTVGSEISKHGSNTTNTSNTNERKNERTHEVGLAASTITRHTQLPHLSTINQERSGELMKNIEAQSQQGKRHTLFSQQAQSDELYLDDQQRERKMQQEQKLSQELQLKQAENQALAHEINRELELKNKRKGQNIFRSPEHSR